MHACYIRSQVEMDVGAYIFETRRGCLPAETNETAALMWSPMRITPHVLGGLSLVALVAAAQIGCGAEGVEDEMTSADLASTPIEAGPGEGESVTLPPSNPPKPQPKEEDGGPADTDAGTGGDAGGGNTGGGNTGGGNTGTGTSCAATNTCMGATDLGMVSGDQGADVKSSQGTGSKWFTVRVTEDDNSAFGAKLWMKATLTSPPGSNYDLYVYVPGSDTRECSAVTKSSTTSATTDTAGVEFGEGGTFSNGSSDDRTVTVEVRHVSGTCSATDQWTLTINGNQK